MMNQEILASTYTEELFLLKPKPIVIISVRWDELSDKDRELLGKIIAALKIPIEAVTLIYQPMLDLGALQHPSNRVIYFGPLPAGLSYYQVMETGQVRLVCSEPLAVLSGNEAARKQLWGALRQAFFA